MNSTRPPRLPAPHAQGRPEIASNTRNQPVDGNVVDLDTAFGQQFLNISVRQAVPHRQHDHLGRESETRERRVNR
jgi:hypothetical protein